eukprot:5514716-Amphidinium_carterae.2
MAWLGKPMRPCHDATQLSCKIGRQESTPSDIKVLSDGAHLIKSLAASNKSCYPSCLEIVSNSSALLATWWHSKRLRTVHALDMRI